VSILLTVSFLQLDAGYQLLVCGYVPTLVGDNNGHPSYSVLGNRFLIGYMKGWIEAV